LEINGKLQNAEAAPCPLMSSKIDGSSFEASFDLTAAYAGVASKVSRSARFDSQSGTVRIDDEITSPAGPVVWRAITAAAPEIHGDDVVLKKDGQQITLRKVSSGGTWSITSAKPPTAAENQNRGYQAVVLTVPKAEHVVLSVEIRP
jgi:hypothetical protein